MKRSITLIGAWVGLVCLLSLSGRGRADDPDCSSCNCAEDLAWALTGDTKSTVFTVYDKDNPDKIGAAVPYAHWKNQDGGKNMVYHSACLDDNHVSEEQCRVLIYNKSWSPICKRTGTQTDDGYIATKYDAKETAYDFPETKLQNRARCKQGGIE